MREVMVGDGGGECRQSKDTAARPENARGSEHVHHQAEKLNIIVL